MDTEFVFDRVRCPDAPTWVRQTHGIYVEQRDGVFYCADARANDLVAGYNPLDRLREAAVLRVKAEAEARIVAIADPKQQSNIHARCSLLIYQHMMTGAWQDGDQEELAGYIGMFGQINVLRQVSDMIEQDVIAMDEFFALQSFDPKLSERWP
jgi:hypothetical protein